MNNNLYSVFTNLYPVTKTLRFELIPQGETLKHIKDNDLINEDIIRAEEYKIMKHLLDEYHKSFINSSLEGFVLQNLPDYFTLYTKGDLDEADRKELFERESDLRKQIVTLFKNQPEYKTLFKSDLIKRILPDTLTDEDEIALVKRFSKFTTYFSGYHNVRENMYSDEEKVSAIAYRLINENLPKFINNILAFEYIKKSGLSEQFPQFEKDLSSIIQINHIEKLFEINYFNHTLTQRGIDTYNSILNGYKDESTHLKGLNNYIAEYNQNIDNSEKLPALQPLFKQILSDKIRFSSIPEKISSDQELLESIAFFIKENKEIIKKQRELLNRLSTFDPAHIYLKNDETLSVISHKFFGDKYKIQNSLNLLYAEKKKSISIKEINKALALQDEKEPDIRDYFKIPSDNGLLMDIVQKNNNLLPLLEKEYPKEKQLRSDQNSIEKIKGFLDAIKKWHAFIKPLIGSGKEADRDAHFYSEFDQLWESLNSILLLYNKARVYLTKKPYSNNKIKLNFNNPTLLSGWSANRESISAATLLFKDDKYYLGIMDKASNKIFKNAPISTSDDIYRKMEYNLIPGANKILPKVFFAKSNIKYFNPSKKVLEIYESGSFKKGNNFNLNDCHTLIDFFKESIEKHPDWNRFGFKFSTTSTYEDINGFYNEVDGQSYMLSYKNIDASYIDECVNEGKLYLFQIYNKDFSENKSGEGGTDNLHTMYWKMLFDETNANNVIYKINGEAEIFYRPASLENPVIHKANEAVKNKNPLNEKKESLFTYDIIKDRRYTKEKFFFHVPITLNFTSKRIGKINKLVRESLQKCEDVHIIGVKRAERHLFSYSVINSKGQIVEQGTLDNIVNDHKNQKYVTDYNELLSRKEAERVKARKSWTSIETIKTLKEGYLSQIIFKLTQLMVKYNAVIVLEDLSFEFIKERLKIEKQIYQKFENMLIEKLSYLVNKRANPESPGGLLHAYQLSQPNYKGRQSGFVFYVQPSYTVKLDPTTGFVNMFYIKYINRSAAIDFFNKFNYIKYNKKEGFFEFAFDYNNFTYVEEGIKTKWIACTYGTRTKRKRNPNSGIWEYETINLTNEIKSLFKSYEIDIEGDIKLQISQNHKTSFYKELLELFRLTVQMIDVGKDEIHVISPIKNKDGQFFNTSESISGFPENSVTNAAYNLAKKGQVLIDILQNTPEKDLEKTRLSLKNKEWLIYMQNRCS